ncbi:arylamine N-acetyltransferase family protein [Kocuria tytonis]|uniref:arylamine N-acetyltransferase family protein n=1 Tax=Kocuria tytonis TaxID=2054280 RepID=UPI00131438DA|nr:arylamine N-acetyltransferase [Kocuria tytonis]
MNSTTASEWQIADIDVPAYLHALGLDAAALAGVPRDLDLLERLHRAHVSTVPFGNVGVLLGEHPGVAPATVFDQLVRRRRGGYCFEHSQLFAAALETLGFTVRRALGRVRSLQSPRTHMTVLVDVAGARYLCDPGFGFSITGPVPLHDGARRVEGDRTFTVGRVRDEGWPLWSLSRDGTMEHVLEESTVHPADVRMGHLMTSTDADSVFRHHLMVMKHTPGGHVTVTERGVTERPPGRDTRHRELSAREVVDRVRDLGVRLTEAEAGTLVTTVTRLRG